jgi:hypothetical protein
MLFTTRAFKFELIPCTSVYGSYQFAQPAAQANLQGVKCRKFHAVLFLDKLMIGGIVRQLNSRPLGSLRNSNAYLMK